MNDICILDYMDWTVGFKAFLHTFYSVVPKTVIIMMKLKRKKKLYKIKSQAMLLKLFKKCDYVFDHICVIRVFSIIHWHFIDLYALVTAVLNTF